MKTPSPAELLAQIAQINLMERGSLCARIFHDRPAQAPPQFKLQSWENGKNYTRHVSAEQLPLVQQALDGFARFQELTAQLAAVIIADTRQQLDELRDASKKKSRRPTSSLPRTRKSNG